ncbi:MAG TPA: hypothetical protein VN238_00920 [Solirubrobacteraceae bacterium]|nr:hypothetical protein [Solirubrobacteraceae bacterium]
MLGKQTRRALCGAVAIAAMAPATASAGTHVFHEGIIWGNETVYSPFAYITEVSARSLDGNTVCVATFDANFNQYGSVACSNGLASHPYDSSVWRRGGARGAQGLGVNARARIDFL